MKFADYSRNDCSRNELYELFAKQLGHDDKNTYANSSVYGDFNVVGEVYLDDSQKQYVLVGVGFEWSKKMIKIMFGGSEDKCVKAEWKMSDYTVESLSKWIIKFARIFSGLVGLLED